VHAVVGGTPAYRREFARDDAPAGAGDYDGWVRRTVLNPASPLFREARYLLAAESELRDMGLYHSVLAAIADGNATRGGIATYTGRKSGDLAHPLNILMGCGLVRRQPDAFRDNRATYEIAEPLITFYHAVMRPIWSDLAHTRSAQRLWERSQPRFTANVLGPHFEQLCRYWTRFFAPEDCTGGFPARVEPGTVNDPASKKTHQVDVAAFGLDDVNREALLAIGEAKWHEVMGMGHLERLRHVRSLLTAQGRHGAATARLLCFSGAGFTAELADEAARSGDLRLLTPADLYAGILLSAEPLRPGGRAAVSTRRATAGQATVTGRLSKPRKAGPGTRRASPAPAMEGNRASRAGNAIDASIRASAAPRQKCGPPPKLSAPASGRSGSKRSGPANLRGSRFPAPNSRSTWVPAATGMPPSSDGAAARRTVIWTGAS
jgi:hypothetical protein